MNEVVLPMSLEGFNVLLLVMSEVFILAMGAVLTKHLYAVLIKRRVHGGDPVELYARRGWAKLIPLAEDLHFQGSWNKSACIFTRLLLVVLSLLASFEIGSVRNYEISGTSEWRLVVNTMHQNSTAVHSFWRAALPLVAKQSCEVVNATHITYKAALFSHDGPQFSCAEGTNARETEIIVLKWRIDAMPTNTRPISVKHSIYNYKNRSLSQDNAARINTSAEHYIEFRTVDNQEFLHTSNYRGDTILELIKPKYDDMFIVAANQINDDRANNVAKDLSIAKSFSNHAVWVNPETKPMTGSFRNERASMSKKGLCYLGAGIVIVAVILPIAILLLRARVSYIKLDPTDGLGLVSLCVHDEKRVCTESLDSVKFGITNHNDAQYLGILPYYLHPVKRDPAKPMMGGPNAFEQENVSGEAVFEG